MAFKTADLCDAHEADVRVLDLPLRDYGGRVAFSGPVSTIRALEDNSRVRDRIDKLGKDIRLEIDGGVKADNIGAIAAAGADTFVAGSAIFNAPDYAAVIAQMRAEVAAARG